MIENMRNYVATCPYLDEFTAVNVNYLISKVKAYSINEEASYNPVIGEDILGNEFCQFKFSFDAKFKWNEEIANNIDNSQFFENFSNWLKSNNKSKTYPTVNNDITVTGIMAISNGYILDTASDEAIYRIACVMYYTHWN